MPLEFLHHQQLAMATRWQWWLAGLPMTELTVVSDTICEELLRWEQLLNRYAANSEVSRLNHLRCGETATVDPQLCDLLTTSYAAFQLTNGYFDVAAQATKMSQKITWRWLPETRQFTWQQPEHQLDFGGIAKGYVLDQLRQQLIGQGVTAALFDAGSSSLLTWGSAPTEQGWPIALHDLVSQREESNFVERVGPSLMRLRSQKKTVFISNQALSFSATRDHLGQKQTTLDPQRGRFLRRLQGCVVLHPSATMAEIWSTAILCMGEEHARAYIKEQGVTDLRWAMIRPNQRPVRWNS
jgi:FAD:protein FMN transferase